MSDSKSLNTSLLEVVITSKNKWIFIGDLNDLTLQIIFNTWWASIHVGSKRLIACNNSTHGPSWWFYLHCRIQETGSPGFICVVCHHVLRNPSDHGTSSIWKHLLAKAQMPKLNKLTKSEVTELTSSTVDETALAILKREGIQGISIGSSRRKIIFNIQVNPY